MEQEQKKQTSKIAVASLVLGCLFIVPFLGVIFGLAAIILGLFSLVTLHRKKQFFKGKGLAIAGIILGLVGAVIIPAIAFLAAVTIPNFMKARVSTKEAVAIANLDLIAIAQIQYRAVNSDCATLAQLGSASPPYIDSLLASGTKDSYKYSVTVTSNTSFYATALPDDVAWAHTFYLDEDAILCRSDIEEAPAPLFHVDIGCPPNFSEVLE